MEPARDAQGAGPRTVCVDRRVVRWAKGTGAATYAAGLRQAVPGAGFSLLDLTDAATADPAPPGRARLWAAALSPRSVPALPWAGGLVADDVFRRAQVHFDAYRRFLRLRTAHPPDLMHWSYPMPVHFAGVPNIYCVHDLIPLLAPGLTPINGARSRRMLHALRHGAAHLVTVSETSRREIIAVLGWPPDRVTNTYQQVVLPRWTPQEAQAARLQAAEAVGVRAGEYFLHVGTVEPRKNIARLIEAYRLSGSRRALVLAGPDGWQATQEMAAAADLLAQAGAAARASSGGQRVIRAGWMQRDALLALVQGATALLAPSLAEGFGLPAVEAMALGTPALTSHDGACAEVAGTGALLVDPRDVRRLADAIAALDGDAGLRARLAQDGKMRAQAFSAAAYSARLSGLYQAVLARHAHRP